MATSGTRTFSLSTSDVIEEAYELAGLELRTGYDANAARRCLNILFADWSNRGVQLWEVEQVSLDLTKDTASYDLNEYDIDVLDAVLRRTSGGTTNDLQMERIDRSEYFNIPVKTSTGRPSQFYVERTTTPKIYLYPTPENSTDKLITYRWKRIQDVNKSTEDQDLPARFIPCMVSGLAYYISVKKNPQKALMLKQMYEEDFKRAYESDRDRSSLRLVPFRQST
jgi:hypothetical protein|tara:strand:- start:3112 stop:3783 length:672 start_codon:yes stop_codon:yes gene_type:complete